MQSPNNRWTPGDISKPDAWILKSAPEYLVDRLYGLNRLSAQSETAFHAWPHLRQAAMRLAAHIGIAFPGREGPLLEETLVDAVQAYRSCTNERSTDAAALAFLNSISLAADGLQRYRLIAEDGNGECCAWQPFKCSISEWIKGLNAVKMRIESCPPLTEEEAVGGRDFLALIVFSHRQHGRLLLQRRGGQ